MTCAARPEFNKRCRSKVGAGQRSKVALITAPGDSRGKTAPTDRTRSLTTESSETFGQQCQRLVDVREAHQKVQLKVVRALDPFGRGSCLPTLSKGTQDIWYMDIWLFQIPKKAHGAHAAIRAWWRATRPERKWRRFGWCPRLFRWCPRLFRRYLRFCAEKVRWAGWSLCGRKRRGAPVHSIVNPRGDGWLPQSRLVPAVGR